MMAAMMNFSVEMQHAVSQRIAAICVIPQEIDSAPALDESGWLHGHFTKRMAQAKDRYEKFTPLLVKPPVRESL
jgi:hypothetical protein